MCWQIKKKVCNKYLMLTFEMGFHNMWKKSVFEITNSCVAKGGFYDGHRNICLKHKQHLA